ncbi:hypothetical protein WME81_35810 [Sorangium sp. So ce1078]
MAPLDELRAVEVQSLDVKPATRREPDEPAVDRLLDVRAEIVALRAKEPQALRCIVCGRIVALEPVARGASVDEVLDVIGPTRCQRVEVINLQLAPTDVS